MPLEEETILDPRGATTPNVLLSHFLYMVNVCTTF